MSIFVKITSHFGGKIQMWLTKQCKKLTSEKIFPLLKNSITFLPTHIDHESTNKQKMEILWGLSTEQVLQKELCLYQYIEKNVVNITEIISVLFFEKCNEQKKPHSEEYPTFCTTKFRHGILNLIIECTYNVHNVFSVPIS